MSVGEVCNRDVVCTAREASVADAAQLMRRYHIGDVVVVDRSDGRAIPVGILTDRDIVIELIAKNVPLDSVRVEDVMSSDLVFVQEDRGVWDSIRCMQAKGVRRIVVANGEGTLVGIVSIDDLLELLSQELLDLVKVITREQDREKKAR